MNAWAAMFTGFTILFIVVVIRRLLFHHPQRLLQASAGDVRYQLQLVGHWKASKTSQVFQQALEPTAKWAQEPFGG